MAPTRFMVKKEHILVFEPLSGGHRGEFISHLMEHIRRAKPEGKTYTFVVGEGMLGERDLPSGVSLREISPAQRDALSRSHGIWGRFVFWRILKIYLLESRPDRLIIMDLTWLELPLCFHRPSCPLTGILFVQYPELRSGSCTERGRRVRFWAKELKTWRFIRNIKPQKIFLLNGAFSCDYLNRRFGVSCYKSIPDPVFEMVADPDVELRREYGIEDERRIFLLFGSMSDRKGVGGLVNAIESLPEETAKKSAFVFCGLPEPGYAVRYRELVDNLVMNRPDVCLHLEERFVSGARMHALFEQADWILMPYTRPEYSSGILVHAAAASTPVIGSEDGLVGRQIRKHGLGLDIKIHLEGLRAALEKSVDEDYVFDDLARLAFVEASSPNEFAATLLDI